MHVQVCDHVWRERHLYLTNEDDILLGSSAQAWEIPNDFNGGGGVQRRAGVKEGRDFRGL